MNEQDRTIVYVVKTTDGEYIRSIPQPFYGTRPIIAGFPLLFERAFTVRMADGPITINPRYILYIQELTEHE